MRFPFAFVFVAVAGLVAVFLWFNAPAKPAKPPVPDAKAAANEDRGGAAAPDFTLKTHDGKSLTLSDLKGKSGAVLVFFATWCPHCMAAVPETMRFVGATRDKGVLVYGVNIQQTPEIVEKFVIDRGINYRVLLDTDAKVARQFGVTGIPDVVGIDAQGMIRYRGHALPDDSETLVRALAPAATTAEAKAAAGLRARPTAQTISKETLAQWLDTEKGMLVVDVLDPEIYRQAHIKGAINIPLMAIESQQDRLPKDARIVTYSASLTCQASASAADKLAALGYGDVYDYKGGMAEWREARLPIEEGALSHRMAAGAVVCRAALAGKDSSEDRPQRNQRHRSLSHAR